MESNLFLSTAKRSPKGRVACLMQALNLNRCAYFVLRGGTTDERAYLQELLGSSVIACLPLRSLRHPRRRHQLWILAASPKFSDQDIIESYQCILRHIFADKCHTSVKICQKIPTV